MFSVVIPLYNKEKYIRETIESVLNQTYQNFEIIIVNDGSTDNSINEVNKVLDSRIRIVNQENSGVGVARNTGISNANFEWIAFLDGDDLWCNDHLSELKKIINIFPDSGLISTQHSKFNERPVLTGKHSINKFPIKTIDYFEEASIYPTIIWTSAACINKRVFDEIGGFSKEKMGEDLEYWVKISLDYQVSISLNTTAYYRQNTGGAMDTYGHRQTCKLHVLGDVNAPLALLEQKAKLDTNILKQPRIIKYINAILQGDVRSSFYYDNIIMAKEFAKLAIPDKSSSFVFLSLVNLTPGSFIKLGLKIYKKVTGFNKYNKRNS